MTKAALVFFVLIISAVSALAQSGSEYTIDNFDFANGVRIEIPAARKPASTPRRLTRLTASRISKQAPLINNNTFTNFDAANSNNALSGFTTGNTAVDAFIVDSGKRNEVDPLLLYSIMHQESTFKRNALSPKGASGLMQLMPPTARRFGVSKIWDPQQNIEGGARYMRFLLDQFGDVHLALAGYNAGEGAVMKYGNRVPPYRETQEYVRRISKRYNLMRDPQTAHLANNLSRQQLAFARQKESAPLTVYEQSVFAVRLPDGRLQLVSQ
ncbi:MAG TPA: lytic transglycosylase domain-containing protein [Pyrinomonadaceae bacterium]|nr:lytic transglycosylase domain-containing protein [Pyrinomonadaceae bacterium]